jgi:F0F1-type ATP synthase membrane subunit b/b'
LLLIVAARHLICQVIHQIREQAMRTARQLLGQYSRTTAAWLATNQSTRRTQIAQQESATTAKSEDAEGCRKA